MTVELAGSRSDADRELCTQVSAEYAGEYVFRARAHIESAWGVFEVPKAQASVLGKVSGLDVPAPGSGTSYELGASPGARTHPHYGLATARPAGQWPAEELRGVQLAAGASRGG